MTRYPCIDPPYKSQEEATRALYAAYEARPVTRNRETWICIDGHWHEGEVWGR